MLLCLCSGPVITGLSFRSMLQTWLIAGLGSWTSRPSAAGAQPRGHASPGMAPPAWSRPGARSPGAAARLRASGENRHPGLGGCPCRRGAAPRRLGPRLLRQVEASPFKPARANQGPARPPVQTRAAARPRRPRGSEAPAPGRVGAGEPAASVTGEQHRRLGLQASRRPERAAMARSLHRVSLGSRRAHPGLSFYLTTFGKCPCGRCQGCCTLLSAPRKGAHGDR